MLTIDIGNSRVKWALFEAEIIIRQGVFAYERSCFAEALVTEQLPIQNNAVFVSNVAGIEIEQIMTHALLSTGCEKYEFVKTRNEQCGITNGYMRPLSLGVDRWLAMIAAYHSTNRKSVHNICVIDCGTAVTVDIVNTSGHHLGGYIAPGYQAMQSVLSQRTSDIETTTRLVPEVLEPAGTTEEAIERGCMQFLYAGVQAMLKQCVGEAPSVDVFITGGDAVALLRFMQEEVDVIHDPLLVNRGLYYVAKYSEPASH